MDIKRRSKQLVEILEKAGAVNIIVTQVDPDALGAGLGLGAVVEKLNANCQCQIYYCGYVGHPQNRCLFNAFDLKKRLRPIKDIKPQAGDIFAFVDSSAVQDGRLGELAGKISPTIVIDHHRSELRMEKGKFIWIEDVGAASTMLVELMNALNVELDDDNKFIALILGLGIYSDTKALISGSKRDRQAFGHISTFFSTEELNRFISYPLSETHFQNLACALNNMKRQNAALVASCHYLSNEHGDDLSTIADYLLRMDGITKVFVWAIVGNAVRVSARTRDISVPLDQFLKDRFGDKSGAKLAPDGHSEGGALISLDLGFWKSSGAKDELLALIGKRLEEELLGE